MREKRLILAISLSLLVLLSWSAWVSKAYHIENKEDREKVPELSPTLKPLPATTELPKEFSPTNFVTLALDKYDVVFSETEAAIQEIKFKDYQSYSFFLQNGIWIEQTDSFQTQDISSNRVTFIYKDENKQIIKRFIFSNSNYNIELEIEVQNLSTKTLKINLPLVLGLLSFERDQAKARYQDITIATEEKILHLTGHKEGDFIKTKFVALREQYFCAIIEPVSNNYQGFVKKINAQKSRIGLISPESLLDPGQKIEQKFRIYLGPQELKFITPLNADWSAVMHFGTFNLISQFLLQLLEWLYSLVHNWGWAIIILSLLIYFLLFPFNLKQMHAMKQMQLLQPHIEELRRIYKDNPQRLNKEIMALYRQHKVNPFGGCLPLVLQMPIFFALYQALNRSILLKGASFLWIKDLSEPDRLLILPISLPILGNEINLLPLIMTIGMFIQQKFTASTSVSSSPEQQKIMMIVFPLMFGLIFYHMPSGLVLYWFINTGLMLISQLRMHRTKVVLK